MNKREKARQERIDFVISHSHVGDLRPSIEFLREVERGVNCLYELNIRYAMSVVNPEVLVSQGWREVDVAGQRLHMFALPGASVDGVYLSLSSENRWQFLGDKDRMLKCDWRSPFEEGVMQLLESHLLPAIEVLPPQTLAEEESMLRQICPVLRTSTGKVIDISQEKIFSIWERMVRYWHENSDDNSAAIVFSMLRHLEELAGEVWFFVKLANLGSMHSVLAWCAIGCRAMLEYIPDGCICTMYSCAARILRAMGCHLAAFHCINICWLYTPQQPWYQEPYFEYVQSALAEQLGQDDRASLKLILEAADFYATERKGVSGEESAPIGYFKGLLAATDGDYAAAVQQFELASQGLSSTTECGYVDCNLPMRLQLRKCLDAAKSCLGRKRGFKRHLAMFELCLEYFPHIPWYYVVKGGDLPAPMDYPGHGDHLSAVLGRPVRREDVEEFASMLNHQDNSEPEGSTWIPHGNGGFSLEVYPLALPSHSEGAQMLALVMREYRGDLSVKGAAPEVLAVFPAIESSRTTLLKRPVSKFAFDAKHMDCLFTLDLPMGDVEFYMLPADIEDYCPASECDIALSAIGYRLEPLVSRTIPATDPDGKKVEVYITDSLRVLTRSAGGGRDDAEFVAQIQEVRKINFLETSLWLLVLSFDERAYDLRLPLLINCANVQKDYIPKKGDVVTGVAWLQGRLDCSEMEYD